MKAQTTNLEPIRSLLKEPTALAWLKAWCMSIVAFVVGCFYFSLCFVDMGRGIVNFVADAFMMLAIFTAIYFLPKCATREFKQRTGESQSDEDPAFMCMALAVLLASSEEALGWAKICLSFIGASELPEKIVFSLVAIACFKRARQLAGFGGTISKEIEACRTIRSH
jgi:hypothetical protein